MTNDLPAAAGKLAKKYPEIWEAYSNLGEACANSGPLDDEARRLIKLALAIGAGSEGAVHSHVRRALEAGISAEKINQVAMLSIPTLGFPQAVAAWTWIEDLTNGA
jgi:alkylhydroperoxidase/carboxymuconolactone decarboxylase family protein YurZ